MLRVSLNQFLNVQSNSLLHIVNKLIKIKYKNKKNPKHLPNNGRR